MGPDITTITGATTITMITATGMATATNAATITATTARSISSAVATTIITGTEGGLPNRSTHAPRSATSGGPRGSLRPGSSGYSALTFQAWEAVLGPGPLGRRPRQDEPTGCER